MDKSLQLRSYRDSKTPENCLSKIIIGFEGHETMCVKKKVMRERHQKKILSANVKCSLTCFALFQTNIFSNDSPGQHTICNAFPLPDASKGKPFDVGKNPECISTHSAQQEVTWKVKRFWSKVNPVTDLSPRVIRSPLLSFDWYLTSTLFQGESLHVVRKKAI